jgi:hypothetical protein
LRELGSALSLARTLHSFIGVVVGLVPPSLPPFPPPYFSLLVFGPFVELFQLGAILRVVQVYHCQKLRSLRCCHEHANVTPESTIRSAPLVEHLQACHTRVQVIYRDLLWVFFK